MFGYSWDRQTTSPLRCRGTPPNLGGKMADIISWYKELKLDLRPLDLRPSDQIIIF